MTWKRIKLNFTPGLQVNFANRDQALKQIEHYAEESTRLPIVIYGPEGCGKTALSKQAIEILKDHGYSVIYISRLSLPLHFV
ncbi:MAG: hypothetical protein DRN03_06530 [Thermoplasmata archaeon]|nr:MAG: hypothetical protein DRN03_06530 [Thermoplasmata archaeon]